MRGRSEFEEHVNQRDEQVGSLWCVWYVWCVCVCVHVKVCAGGYR